MPEEDKALGKRILYELKPCTLGQLYFRKTLLERLCLSWGKKLGAERGITFAFINFWLKKRFDFSWLFTFKSPNQATTTSMKSWIGKISFFRIRLNISGVIRLRNF